jgi:hypothetical protein
MWDGGIDDCDVQELAIKHELIEPVIATEEDAHNNDDITAGDEIFRYAEWLKP